MYDNKAETDSNYDRICRENVDMLIDNNIMIVATHNNSSVYKVLDLIESRENKEQLKENVFFASLYGLNDYLAYETLANGYNTLKYLTYGE